MPFMPGKTALLELLKQEGVPVTFGNPGMTELSLMDAPAVETEPHYVFRYRKRRRWPWPMGTPGPPAASRL